MAISFSANFSASWFSGSPLNVDVPHKWDVSIGGRGYMLDRKMMASGQYPLISTIRATRAQSDGSQEPGEQSLNPDDLWRRTQQSWHLGAGQDYLDREDSSRYRFRSSKGIDIWTRGQISLLNTTAESLISSATNLCLMPAGARLYCADDTALKYTTDLTNWSTTTGTSGSTITSLASDGFYVWITDGANVYRTNTGTTSASSWSTTDADILGYVKGRLMYADGNIVGYFSDMATPTSTALFTHANSAFTWVGFAEGPGHIYAAGYAGDKSLVYRIAITREGTSLDAPVVAGELPDGEVIHSIGSYLGFILLGTSAGARFCTLDGQGNLTIGKLIETSNPVKGFEGQGEFIWFGWTNYDATSTGLGRMSLRDFSDIDALAPAYASDLMVDTQANVLAVCTFLDRRVFSVSGDGVYAESTTSLVASGTMDCGLVNYGITEQKIAAYIDLMFAASFAGSHEILYSPNDSATFTSVGTVSTAGSTNASFAVSETALDQIEVRHTLTRDGSDATAGPTLLRYTLRSLAVPALRRRLVLPVVLHDQVQTNSGLVTINVAEELNSIEGYRTTRQVLSAQVGNENYSGSVEDYDHIAMQPTHDRSAWQGTCVVQIKTI